jgi:hypothetical protein
MESNMHGRRTVNLGSQRGNRRPLRSGWLAVLLVLSVAPAASGDLEGTQEIAEVFSAGGGTLTGGAFVFTTVLGEGVTWGKLTGAHLVMRPGFLSRGELVRQSAAIEEAAAPELATRLVGSFPNPFNPAATIRFDLARHGEVTLRIYDVRGRLVRTLVEGALEPGAHRALWDGRSSSGRPASSGVYVVELRAGEVRARQKLVLAR